jgi:hypothetical protein
MLYVKKYDPLIHHCRSIRLFLELPRKFPDIVLGAYVVMPSHDNKRLHPGRKKSELGTHYTQ